MSFTRLLKSSFSSSAESILPSSSSSSTSSASSSRSTQDHGKSCKTSDGDTTFSELINNSQYKPLKDVEVTYEVYIDDTQLHWCLLIKMKGSDLPFLSLEASTPDFSSLRHEMFLHDKYEEKIKSCGKIDGKLSDILNVADDVIIKMGKYSVFSSNCQHFCNNVLHYYNFEVYSTTFGEKVTAEIKNLPKETDDVAKLQKMFENDEELNAIIDNPLSSTVLSKVESRSRAFLAKMFNEYVGASHH